MRHTDRAMRRQYTQTEQLTRVRGNTGSGPKVLHVVRSLEIGGLERVVCELVCERGVERTAVACLTARGEFADSLEAKHGRVHVLGERPVGAYRLIARLTRLLITIRPDIIHCHNMFAHLVGASAASLCGWIPTVLTKHGTHIPHSRMGSVLQRALIRRSHVVAVSTEIAEIMSRWAPFIRNRIVAISNGISLPGELLPDHRQAMRAQYRWKGADCVFISVSRIVEGKRLDDLLRAFANLRLLSVGAKLVIVGDGPVLPALKRLGESLGLGDSVEYLGQRLDIVQLLGAADAFVLSSENEGLPMAVLEAMAAGLPIVATAVGDVPIVVNDGQCGFVVPPHSPDYLTQAMLRIVKDPAIQRKLGANARERITKHFSVAAATEKYERIYTKAIGAR